MKRQSEKSALELYFEREMDGDESEETETISVEEEEEGEKKPKAEVMILSDDQKQALMRAKQGMNLLITGNAGSGKSFVIEKIIEAQRKSGKSVALTASTGIAAFHLGQGASTLHSFSGVGLGEDPPEKLLEFVRKRPTKLKLWNNTDVLIIDEFSMISTDFFLKLDYVARRVRGKFEPFGGLQLILVGDYFQCPSIEKAQQQENSVLKDPPKRFPFQTPLWKEAKFFSISLKKNFRQAGDLEFFQLLESVKLNKTELADFVTLSSRLIEKHPDVDQAHLIKLCPRRAKAEEINANAIRKIQSESHFFKGDYIKYNDKGHPIIQKAGESEKKFDRYPADMNLELKVGVEVLLCCNEDVERGLVNGARGKVICFELPEGVEECPEAKRYPLVEFENGERLLATPHVWETKSQGILVESFIQVPLILRYAMTIHKAQGLTLDRVLVYCDFFENGQGYVALSRVRKLSDLYLEALDMNKFTTHPDVIEFYRKNKLL